MLKTITDVQRYWDARPCNVRHSAKPVGSEEYFHEVEARKYFVEPHIPPFAQFERWREKRVLEVGCGIGTDSINFARAGAHLTERSYRFTGTLDELDPPTRFALS